MRISRSPQNGGFQRWTGGGPLRAASRAAPAIASSPRRSCSTFCAMAPLCAENDRGSSVAFRRGWRGRRGFGALGAAPAGAAASYLDMEADFQHPFVGNLEEVRSAAGDPDEERVNRE